MNIADIFEIISILGIVCISTAIFSMFLAIIGGFEVIDRKVKFPFGLDVLEVLVQIPTAVSLGCGIIIGLAAIFGLDVST